MKNKPSELPMCYMCGSNEDLVYVFPTGNFCQRCGFEVIRKNYEDLVKDAE